MKDKLADMTVEGMMFPKGKKRRRRRKSPKSVMVKGRKRLWSIFSENMDRCMYTGAADVERHHVFHHTSAERVRCEEYGFIAPLRPDLHPNGVKAGKHAAQVDKDLKRRCQAYYLRHYGSKEDFGREFYYVS